MTSYLQSIDQFEATELEREKDREYEAMREAVEDQMAEYYRELQRELEDGWLEDIRNHEMDQMAYNDWEDHGYY